MNNVDMKELSIISRCFGCIIDKLLIFILFFVLLLCVYSPYVVPGWLGAYSVLIETKPSMYEYIDKANEQNYSRGSNCEVNRITDYYKRTEIEQLQNIGKNTSLSLDIRLTTFFLIISIVYYFLSELFFRCSVGKALVGGTITTAEEKWGFSLCLWRSLLLGFMMFVAVCLRFALDVNYYVTVLGFVFVSDVWILFKRQSLVDIFTGTYVVIKSTVKDSVTSENLMIKNVQDNNELLETIKKFEEIKKVNECFNESSSPSPSINGVVRNNFHASWKALAENKHIGIDDDLRISDLKDQTVTEKTEDDIKISDTKNEKSVPKYIGYNPINIFAQTNPINYPYVLMPKRENCIIKFPRKGRNGRKGYKEDAFGAFLQLHFSRKFNVYNDRFILTRNNTNRYEPDFTLIDENNGINVFMDIEIDEPYEGLNDIDKRNVTHYQLADTNRNNEFISRGWIVVRFAEIQVHQNPEGCCRFIADVIKSINQDFVYPTTLLAVNRLVSIPQWNKEQAKEWSIQKYRQYSD